MDIKRTFKEAFPHTIPVMTGYIFMGMAFGILLGSKGYHFGWAILMSFIIYAGSMQFVAIDLLTGGFHLFYSICITLMVNARHIFYGLSLLDTYKTMGKKKPYMMFALTDETYSLLTSAKPKEGVNKNLFYFIIAVLDHSYWIIGCTLGAILGSMVSINTKGIDFVMTALFIVIFMDQWKGKEDHSPAMVGILSSIVCLLIFGAENFILPAMIVILVILTIFRNKLEGRNI